MSFLFALFLLTLFALEIGVKSVFIDYHHFARQYVADKFSADAVDYTAFGGEHIAVLYLADTERTETEFISERY